MSLDYTANPTFSRIHQDPARFIFVRGPVGSGKSSGCILHCFLNAMKQKPDEHGVRYSKYIIIRSSYPALKSTVVKSWQSWFKNLIKIVYTTPIHGEVRVQHPDGVTEIAMDLEFIALDRDEEVEKLQSLEATGSHINEATGVPQSVHQMLKSRIARFPAEKDGGVVDPFIIADYNPPDTEHWIYKLAEEENPDRHSFYTQPPAMLQCAANTPNAVKDKAGNWYKLNPRADNLLWLPDNYYEDQVVGADADWVNVFVLNNYGMVRTGRPVYTDYVDSIHVADKPIKPLAGVPLIIGMDMGLTPAAAFMQLSPTGKLIIFDEITTEDCSIQKFCSDYLWPLIKNKYRGMDFMLILDPAAIGRSQNDAVSAADIIQQAGLPYRTAKTNNPLARREAVIKFLTKLNGFELSPTCKAIRKGFISHYCFEKVRSAQSEIFKEKPEKNFWSHVHDAVQYGALELAEGSVFTKAAVQPQKPHRPASAAAGY